MSDFKGLYAIRDFHADDANFILATSLRGIYYGNSWFGLIPKDIFMENYAIIIRRALVNPSVKIRVACLKEDSNIILGYSILSADMNAIVWVFVKSAWRKQGIGRSLLPEKTLYVTHLTDIGKLLLSKLNGAVFNPFY